MRNSNGLGKYDVISVTCILTYILCDQSPYSSKNGPLSISGGSMSRGKDSPQEACVHRYRPNIHRPT